ncbi:type II secretion system protein N [Roseiconus nitratireducens]|uniref:type II secretion system protein N n=1 Tax=Roseiconus nitratireducens TaxID=2605748 RepID=UPI00191C5AD9|nr:type II secretion system protein N [Roseiconus nitratireducens]
MTNQRRLIRALTAALLAIAGGSALWSVSDAGSESITGTDAVAVQIPSSSASNGRLPRSADATNDPAVTTMDWSLPLQQPLVDPPPPKPSPPPPRVTPTPKPKPSPPPQPELGWTLEGTILDDDRSVAILTDRDGKTDIRGVGETVQLHPPGVTVRAIESDVVTLDREGRPSTVKLKQSFSSKAGSEPNRPRRRNR